MFRGTFWDTCRGQVRTRVAEVGASNLFLLFVLAVIILQPLFFVGHTTNDEANYAITKDIWIWTKHVSRDQGRFNYLWNAPLFCFPYAVDSRVWSLAAKYGSFLLLLPALYYAVYRLFRSSWLALASLIFFLAFIQNGWDHNPLSTYNVSINFYIIVFLVSLALYSDAVEQKNIVLAGLAGGLYFFTFALEFFVLFFPFYLAVLLSRAAPGESVRTRLLSHQKYIWAIVLPLVAFLVLYLAWRWMYPSHYGGNNLDGFSLLGAARVVVTYSLNAFPLSSLRFVASPGEQLGLANVAGWRAILADLNAAHVIRPAVAGFLFVRLMTAANFVVPPLRTLMTGAALAFTGIFLPNVLLGLTQKYQDWVAAGSRSYIYTYHSCIAAMIFVALVLAIAKARSRSWPPGLRRAVLVLGTGVVIVVSFTVEVRSQYIAFDQKLSHRKWQLMDVVITSPMFREIPEGSTVAAPTLSAHQRNIAEVHADYWTRYTRFKTGRDIRFVEGRGQGLTPGYVLVFRQAAHADDQFMVLAKLARPDSWASSELTVYSLPNQAKTTLLASFVPGAGPPVIAIAGVPAANVGTNVFAAELPYSSGQGLVQSARITGNVGIIPEQLTLSHHGVEPGL